MTNTKPENPKASLKMKDITYGLLGLIVGFFISFSVTNSMQRKELAQRGGMGAAQQSAVDQSQLPSDHPPIESGASSQPAPSSGELPPGHPPIGSGAAGDAMGAVGPPPPLPSLEPTGAPGPKAEQEFKDIKVLRGLPPNDVNRIMDIMSASLGVDCNYCHVPGSFESPHPKKDITRKMVQMVKDINKNYVGGKVNCYTCHHGSPQPATQ
jgi:hypothetical protein